MRMCANVPAQHAIQTALGGYQSIEELIGARRPLLRAVDARPPAAQRDPRRHLVKPARRALLLPAPRPGGLRHRRRRGRSCIDLLRAKKILVTHGTGFNWPEPDHFRLVTLPDVDVLEEAIGRIADFLATTPVRISPPGGPRLRAMRDLTYPPIIVTAKLGFKALGQRFAMTGHRARPAHRRRAAGATTTSATSTSSTAASRRNPRGGWCASWPSASCSTTGGSAR